MEPATSRGGTEQPKRLHHRGCYVCFGGAFEGGEFGNRHWACFI